MEGFSLTMGNAVGGSHKELIFNGSGSQQGIPVLEAFHWPGSYHKENGNTIQGKLAGQFWETQVIADDNPAFYAIQHKGGYFVARGKVLVLLGGSKEVDFVVGGYMVPVRSKT